MLSNMLNDLAEAMKALDGKKSKWICSHSKSNMCYVLLKYFKRTTMFRAHTS